MEAKTSAGNSVGRKGSALRWWRWLLGVVVGFALLTTLNAFYDLDKIVDKVPLVGARHYGVDLVNDTTQPLDLFVCLDNECDSLTNKKHLDPGESRRAVGSNEPYWWLAKDEAGNVVGCWRIDFELSDHGIDLPASQLQPCP